MTSFAFILGVVPLVIAEGAGAASRRALGTTVFGGYERRDATCRILRSGSVRDRRASLGKAFQAEIRHTLTEQPVLEGVD